VNYLCNRRQLQPGSDDYGHAFEHFMIVEIRAYLEYSGSKETLSYWRVNSKPGYEVDAIIGDGRIGIEFKSTKDMRSNHTKGLKAFSEEFPDCRLIIVSNEPAPRMLNGVEIIPAEHFLEMLLQGKII